jgi:hypothetical protein
MVFKLKPKKNSVIENNMEDENDENNNFTVINENNNPTVTSQHIDNKIKEKLGVTFFDNKFKTYHYISAVTFVNSGINKYVFNDKLNKNHTDQLHRCYLQNKDIQGIFTTAIDKNGVFYLLDGHHRFRALKKARDKDNSINPCLIIQNYKIDYVGSPATTELFNKINKIKPFVNNEKLNRARNSIINKINVLFPNRIKDSNNSRCYNINQDYLIEAINKRLEMEDIDNINEKLIIREIRDKNKEISEMSYPEIKLKWKKITQEQFERMQGHQCFLGLFRDYSGWFDE